MDGAGGEGTPVFEIDLAAVIGPGTAAPFAVCVARAGIDDLEDDWGRVAGVCGEVICPVWFCLDEFHAFAAGEVVV